MERVALIFTRARYFAAGTGFALLFFALLALTSNMIVWSMWELNPFVEPWRIAMNAFIALLFGANVGVLLHNADLRNGAAGGAQMTTLGGLAALMTSSCPLCQPFFLLAFGFGGLGALIASLNIVIALFSVGLLAISLKRGLDAADGTCGMEPRRR